MSSSTVWVMSQGMDESKGKQVMFRGHTESGVIKVE